MSEGAGLGSLEGFQASAACPFDRSGFKNSMEHWWNDTARGNRTTDWKIRSSARLSTSNLTCTGLGSNHGMAVILNSPSQQYCKPPVRTSQKTHRRRLFFNKTIAWNTKVDSAKYCSDGTALGLRGSYSVARIREIKKGFLSKTAV